MQRLLKDSVKLPHAFTNLVETTPTILPTDEPKISSITIDVFVAAGLFVTVVFLVLLLPYLELCCLYMKRLAGRKKEATKDSNETA